MTSISVTELLKSLDHESPTAPLPKEVTGVTSDSRTVRKGVAFVAVRGTSQNGHRFIPEVDAAGASLIVGEEVAPAGLRAPYLRVKDSHEALARLAANFHGNPSHSMIVVGVTGTSGKTTTTYLVESLLVAAGKMTGLIGTVEYRYGGKKALPSTHTTPGAVELQALLAEMRREGCEAVVMEVSSHALKQARTGCIAFDAAAFSNLSREHLDFHPDMEDYFVSKRMLFSEYKRYADEAGKKPVGAVNVDDDYGRRLAREARIKVLSYGLGPDAEVSGAKLAIDLNGIRGSVGDIEIESELTGKFNVSNILAAVAVGKGLGLDAEQISRGISALKAVPGRLERVPNRAGIHVLVDYAHKSDALEKVLLNLQQVRSGHRLITVFGCGGDRDRLKRPVMGGIAARLSDYVWVTSDNPRTEDANAIIEEILKGIPQGSHYKVEPDRKRAIEGAIAMAKPGDLVLIAGKGHEDYQILPDPSQPGKTKKIHFDDREIAAQALEKHA